MKKTAEYSEDEIQDLLENLAYELELDVSEIEYTRWNTFKCDDGREYYVFKSFDDAVEYAKASIQQQIEDEPYIVGIDRIIDWAVDDDKTSFYEDFVDEEVDYQINELRDEDPEGDYDDDEDDDDYDDDDEENDEDGEENDEEEEEEKRPRPENRLEELMQENDCDDEYEYAEILKEEIRKEYGSYKDYTFERMKEWYSDEDLAKKIMDDGLFDSEGYAEWVVDMDGPANELARYDGHEVELIDGCVAYRAD